MKRLIGLAFIILGFISCQKHSTEVNIKKDIKTTSETFGKLHNQMLSYVNKNWSTDPEQNNKTEDDDIALLTEEEATLFNSFIHSLAPGTIDTTGLSFSTIYPIAYNINSDYKTFCEQNYPSGTSAYDVAPFLYEYKRQQIQNDILIKTKPNGLPLFSVKEKNFIDSMLIRIGRVETVRDYGTFPAVFDGLDVLYSAQNFDTETGDGYISSICLEIGKNSYQYWSVTNVLDNPNGTYESVTALPLWVGLDALGAVAGGVSSLVSGGSLGQAGSQALIWGGAGSVPATRWFRRLFF
ncbi:MAG TPA: hypothetical protein PKA77_14410 [Chitinophagaceae bacterium]|jgi:hypothetical protein|nr:hypothetical protein [Chitinophagaceae bacterium]HMU59509.1 hypothetical protein [Chitinophagaceae bacterium]